MGYYKCINLFGVRSVWCLFRWCDCGMDRVVSFSIPVTSANYRCLIDLHLLSLPILFFFPISLSSLLFCERWRCIAPNTQYDYSLRRMIIESENNTSSTSVSVLDFLPVYIFVGIRWKHKNNIALFS